ncbi:alkaline phosphatase D [Blastomyces parvus]|uniref:Alkaline phosphatase D n=1 Tax=Blastomyces parvus TaxID=2060905 RepID=A0A2B7WQN4_9EURO|nr:alkaline phosphatase D [Blastomyces parvus]
MPTYRIEEASTSRAGCKNKECQEKKEKILKGELRLGTWVDTENFQSWAWKHWGCVTPRQIASIQEIVGDERDCTLIDGYDEISAENQEKFREAVAQGHVSDADWKGDVEVNRPGKSGFRVRVSKKQDTKGDSPQKVNRRGKRGVVEESSEEEVEPVPKKAKTAKAEGAGKTKTAKRKSIAADAGGVDDSKTEQLTSPRAKPTKGRKKKAADEAPAKEETSPTSKTRGRRVKPKTSKAAEAENSTAPGTASTKAARESVSKNTRRTRSGRKTS